MATAADPTLQSIVGWAVKATGAESGWLLGLDGDSFAVLAAAGGPHPGSLVGRRVEPRGAAGFAAASGQPAALRPGPEDSSNAGAGGSEGSPSSVLAVPCDNGETVGVLELVNSPGGGFGIDDIEVATLLADIAATAIVESGPTVTITDPAELGAELTHLAEADPARYRQVATILQALLGQS